MPLEDTGGPEEVATADALKALALSRGIEIPSANNLPVRIDDPESVWFVECGAVNVFVVKFRDGLPDAAPRHLIHAGAGRLIFGTGTGAEDGLMFKGLPDTVVRRIPCRLLAEANLGAAARPASDQLASQVIRQIDKWILQFVDAIVQEIEVRPRIDTRLLPGMPSRAGILTAASGVVWLTDVHPGASFFGLEPMPSNGTGLVPLTPTAWIDVPAPAGTGSVVSSAGLAERIGIGGLIDSALADFHRMAIGSLGLNRRLLLVDTVNLRRASASWRHLDESRARQRLYGVSADTADPQPDRPPLVAALDMVARHEGARLHVPTRYALGEPQPAVENILEMSGLRHRMVRLSTEAKWWLGDHGALLAFSCRDGRPMALLPNAVGRYRAVDPTTGTARFLSSRSAAEVEDEAWQLYPEAADDESGPIGFPALFGVVGKGLVADVARLVVAGLAAGLLAMVPPLALGALLEHVVPAGSFALLLWLMLLLVGVSHLAALAHVLRGTAVMRIEGRVTARISAALMDRVLRVKAESLKDFTTGELGMRIAAFDHLRDRVANAVVSSMLSMIFLLPALVVVFLYSTTLGWVVLALGMASLSVIGLTAAAQIKPNQRHLEAVRRLAGSMRQFVEGLAKLRAARSQAAALAVWARFYRNQKDAEADAAAPGEHIAAFCTALPVFAGAAIVAVVCFGGPSGPTITEFLVVFAVSMTFFTSITAFGTVFQAAASIIPSCQQARPILEAEVDRHVRIGNRPRLNGELLLDRVSFRYENDGPVILDEVTIRAEPGELIALVGGSGAGKSTLLSLMLGLLEPTSGGIYYDGIDLSHLDPVAVRRQIGVVPQQVMLQPGSILSNIVHAAPGLTGEDAWRAAKLAALDETIRAMPMGLHTPVSENGVSLSGGERQRIVIAAALVRQPRIMIFDEATSWLDSVTQERVMENIASVATTRIIVGHRVATFRAANRIYVLQAGRVVQEGSYEELASVSGPFQDLVRRQLR